MAAWGDREYGVRPGIVRFFVVTVGSSGGVGGGFSSRQGVCRSDVSRAMVVGRS
jgi:hypothetical protein